MKALLKLSEAIDWLNHKFALIATLMVFTACFVSAGNAFVRYNPLTAEWSSNAWLELQWYMFAYLVMLGASYTLKMNEHVRVDLLYSSLPPKGKAWVDLLGTCIFMMPAVFLSMKMSWPFFTASFPDFTASSFTSWTAFVDAWIHAEQSSNAGGLIRWPAKLALPLGFGLLALQGLSEIIKRIGFLTGNLNMDTHYERPVQ